MIYDLHERIDGERGGFADVYRATQRETGREVALKMLREHNNADARHRFAQEVKIAKGLNHPGLMAILDANLDAERPFYVMPLMKGGCLTAWAGSLAHSLTRRLTHEFAVALDHMHQRNTLHRDIKPDNILLDAAGRCKIGDFGLGNAPHCTVRLTAGTAGTYGYMAPELGRGGQPSKASDVYSLGATVFHLLTGVHPRDAKTLDPWAYRRDVPAELRNLVLQMCHPAPSKRPAAATVIIWTADSAPAAAKPPIPVPGPIRVAVPAAAAAKPAATSAAAAKSASGDGWLIAAGIAGLAVLIGGVAAAAATPRRRR